MKNGKELGLEVIKCQNKQGSEGIRKIHEEINDVLYPNTYKYIDQELAIDMYTKLCDCGKRLSELKVPEGALAKKKELLSELRKRCMVLKDYKNIQNTVEDTPQMQKVVNFFLHQWIEQKNKQLTSEIILKYLKESKRIYNAFKKWDEHLNLEMLAKANGEMLRCIEITFSIRESYE